MKYYVYWYHLPEQSDPYSEGYIGVTMDLKRRHNQHKYSADNTNATFLDTHFTRAINKYGGIDNLIKTILHESNSYEEIYKLENNYRPRISIGWNMSTGGEYGSKSIFKGVTNRWSDEQKKKIGNSHKGKTISTAQIEYTRKLNQETHPSCIPITLFHQNNYLITYTFHSISEASRKLGIPLSRLKSKNLRKSTSYGDDGWAILFNKDFDRSKTPTGRELAKAAIKEAYKNKKNNTLVSTNDTN